MSGRACGETVGDAFRALRRSATSAARHWHRAKTLKGAGLRRTLRAATAQQDFRARSQSPSTMDVPAVCAPSYRLLRERSTTVVIGACSYRLRS